MKRIWWLVFVVGCALPELTVEGVHVRVAVDPGLVLCGGTVDHMDAFVGLLADEFGVVAPTGEGRIKYYWLDPDSFEARAVCPDGAGGCSFGNSVWAGRAPLNHELVHAVAWPIGDPRAFFIEGLAVAYAGLSIVKYQYRYLGVEQSLMSRISKGVDYWTAGGFTRYLIDVYGVSAFLRFYAKLPFWASRGRIDREFEEAFGDPMGESIALFDRFEQCVDTEPTSMLVECAAPEIGWDGQRVAEYRALACEQEDVVGPYDGTNVVVFRTIEIPEDGEYAVTVIADDLTNGVNDYFGDYFLSLTACGPCQGRERIDLRTGTRGVSVELAAGVYSLRLIGPLREAASVGWSIERQVEEVVD